MFNDPAVLSYTAVKNKRRIGKLKKKNESFSLFIILSLRLNVNFINVLCAKTMLFINTHHVSCHVTSSLYHVSCSICLCCSLHCYSTSRQRSKSLWLHPKVTGCNPLSHYSRFAILLKTFIVSLEMLMRYNNSCNDCNTVHSVWELHSMFWGSVYMEKTFPGWKGHTPNFSPRLYAKNVDLFDGSIALAHALIVSPWLSWLGWASRNVYVELAWLGGRPHHHKVDSALTVSHK